MMTSALSSTPMASPVAAPSPAPAAAASAPAPVADSPNDGDSDDRAVAPVSSPAAQSSSAVQAALPSLTLGG